MKVIILCLLLGTTLGAPGGPTFKEFEEEQHEKFMDPEEEAAAAKEFEKHEAQVEENNADYEAGESNFMEEKLIANQKRFDLLLKPLSVEW